ARFTADRQRLATGANTDRGSAIGDVWDVWSSGKPWQPEAPQTKVTAVAISPTSDLMVVAHESRIRGYDQNRRELLPDEAWLVRASFGHYSDPVDETLTAHDLGITAVDFSADGRFLYTAVTLV